MHVHFSLVTATKVRNTRASTAAKPKERERGITRSMYEKRSDRDEKRPDMDEKRPEMDGALASRAGFARRLSATGNLTLNLKP
jgi:hypothetical protein